MWCLSQDLYVRLFSPACNAAVYITVFSLLLPSLTFSLLSPPLLSLFISLCVSVCLYVSWSLCLSSSVFFSLCNPVLSRAHSGLQNSTILHLTLSVGTAGVTEHTQINVTFLTKIFLIPAAQTNSSNTQPILCSVCALVIYFASWPHYHPNTWYTTITPHLCCAFLLFPLEYKLHDGSISMYSA